MSNPIRVGQLNDYIGKVLRNEPILSNVSVLGEISNLTLHSSGHVYFSLKDRDSKINCFLPRNVYERLPLQLKEEMEIVATGYIAVYKRGGYYSLNIKHIEVSGIGQLAVRFEELKKKLLQEGLFDKAYKKALPVFPNKIAVVTSNTGAAIRDIIKTITTKNNYVDIMIYPVLVQGPNAAEDIARAIRDINVSYTDVDVIIVGRGGGSMEDLWAFNEEIVARSIFNSHIPIVSAVGHETDITIADFVADARAATPTAAGELVAPDINKLKSDIEEKHETLIYDFAKYMDLKYKQVETMNPSVFKGNLNLRVNFEQMNADTIIEEMASNLERHVILRQNMLEKLNPINTAKILESRIDYTQMSIDRLTENMQLILNNRIAQQEQKLIALKTLLDTSNPKSILGRGYSLVKDTNGNTINTTKGLAKGDNITIETSDGSAGATVTDIIN